MYNVHTYILYVCKSKRNMFILSLYELTSVLILLVLNMFHIANTAIINNKIVTGVIDPRANRGVKFDHVDFIVTNGLESQDFFSKF